MLEADELDSNPVFRALQTHFIGYFHWIQDKCGLVCIPHQRSVRGVELNREFIEKHAFRPSPFFKDHYVTNGKHPANILIEDGNIVTAEGFPEKRKVKIISEELGYNKKENDGLLYDSQILFTCAESRMFLSEIPGSFQALASLDREIQTFCNNYLLLPDFLDDASDKLNAIWKSAVQHFLSCFDENTNADAKFIRGRIQLAVESHLLGSVNHKLFPKICEHCQPDDVKFEKCCQLLQKLTPSEIGVPTSLQCDFSHACEKLATLDNCVCTFEKMLCVKRVLDSITESVRATGDEALLTSDQYLPLLMYVIVNQRGLHVVSNLYFLDKFQFYSRPSDSLRAAFSYTQSFSSDLFSSSKQESTETQRNPGVLHSSSSSVSSVSSHLVTGSQGFDRAAHHRIPAPELGSNGRKKFGHLVLGQNGNSAEGSELSHAMRRVNNPALGEFLSALKDDKRHIVYGKQT